MPTFTYVPLVQTGVDLNGQARNVTLATQVRERTAKGVASPRFSAGRKERRAIAEYYIKDIPVRVGAGIQATNIDQCIRDFMGYSEPVISSGVPTGINRFIPYPHPDAPNLLYADTVQEMEPDVPIGQNVNAVAAYDEYKVRTTFSTENFVYGKNGVTDESQLQQYVSINIQQTGKYESFPTAHAFRWINNLNEPMINKAAILLMEGEVNVIWHQIPVEAIPWSAITKCVGRAEGQAANLSYDFLSNTYLGPIFPYGQFDGQPPVTPRQVSSFLCLVPKQTDPYQMANGKWAVDLMYRFKYLPFGANFFYRWMTGRFESAVGPNGSFYKFARFQQLFYGT